ncbi:MAG: sulfatase-like hydrolase/transferase [Opitutales bacterium]
MSTTKTKPPNFLWISFEDTSPRFGCYGDPVAQTPNVDRLAAEGCLWNNAFATAGVCAPSRCSIITGCYAISVGGQHMRTTHRNRATPEMPTPYGACLPPHIKPFTQYLRAAGYFCTNNQKTDYQFDAPRTAWDELGEHAHWRNRPDPAQPFFAVFNPTTTHESGQWPEKGGEPKTDPAKVTLPPYLPDTLEGRKALARQYDHIAQNDALVGDLLQQLEADGLAENTLVMIWSDHGEGLPRAKRWPYDSGIRVPLVVKWPGGALKPGDTTNDLVSLIDLAPTLLSLAGVPQPRHLHGKPFLGPKVEKRTYIHAHRDRFDEAYDRIRTVRDGQFKYLRNYYTDLPSLLWIPYRDRHPIMREIWKRRAEGTLEPSQAWFARETRPPEELYDTQADPWEMHNLAEEPVHAQTLLRLRTECDRWLQEVGDLGDLSEADMKRLWYPDGTQPQTSAPIAIKLGDIAPEVLSEGEQVLKQDTENSVASPALVGLHCATQGASIAYTFDQGDADDPALHWKLYSAPLKLPEGTHTLRSRAIRIGYEESAERSWTLQIG